MNDVFLMLAQAKGGLTCFLVPRVLPSGERNRLDVVRLKDKLGNRSNASSEMEFHGTWAQRLGDEGRGVRTIIEMVAATRLDCVLGSAVADAQRRWPRPRGTSRTARRSAALLADKPLMQNVMADLAVESEAATAAGDAAGRRGRPPSRRRTRRRCAGSRCRWRSSGSASGRR